jgi:hypothetical protein
MDGKAKERFDDSASTEATDDVCEPDNVLG